LLSIIAAGSSASVLCVVNVVIQRFSALGSLPIMGFAANQRVMRIPWSVPVIFWL
jgi:hypothetical protein